jgi:hypothetical protein
MEMAFIVAENPSPTPPHKGEGLQRRNLLLQYGVAEGRIVAIGKLTAQPVSPSPLWGGVGEGFSKSLGGTEKGPSVPYGGLR